LNSVAGGSSTVLINGLPAARVGDATAHGGHISTGEPSVIIGGPPVSIRVEGDEAFLVDVQLALSKLLPTRSGREWLRRMAQTGRTVTIVRNQKDINTCQPNDRDDARNGVGTDSTILWNPNEDTLDPDLPGRQGTPGSAVRLAHEMVHGLHNAEGANRNGPVDRYGDGDKVNRNEERSTVGLSGPVRQPDGTYEPSPPDYSKDVPTENSFRDDLEIPRRPSYFRTRTSGGAPW
jgi:hypothetical protein